VVCAPTRRIPSPRHSTGPGGSRTRYRLANLAGVRAAIWAETIKDFADLTFMLLPRLAGFAEKGWSDTRRYRHGPTTRARLAAHGRLWTQDGLSLLL
jgi:hypothetical protein